MSAAPATAELIAAYRAAKAKGLAASDDEADRASEAWVDAFYKIARCPCRTVDEVFDKIDLMIEVISDQDMTIDEIEALMIFRSMKAVRS